jgi:hypothetical protein
MASEANRVNVTVDYAVGEYDNFFYVFVGEPF